MSKTSLQQAGPQTLSVRVVQPADLSPHEITVWEDMRSGNPALYSPYFHVDYTRLIGELRPDAYVAIAERDGDIAAFFPFQGPQPGRSGFARPIGAPMTDYHGVIKAADDSVRDIEVFEKAGIGALHYSALVHHSRDDVYNHMHTQQAAVMEITDTAESWRAARDSSYRRSLKSHRRRVRKSEEDYGQRRFEFKSRDPEAFETLLRWKREKFIETGKYDVLSADWTMALLERLWNGYGALSCDMQVLYFGNRIASIDLGLSSGGVFHSWIVAYDGDLHTLAPGIQLLEELIDASKALGYTRIDLGAGIDGYKRHYASEDIRVGGGFIAVQGPAAALSQLYGHAEILGQKRLCDAPGKLRRRYSQIAACDDSFAGRAKAIMAAVKSSRNS